jgi:phosphinothricin acetyltransferase
MDTNLATFEAEVPEWEEWDASHLSADRLVAESDGRILGWAALSAVSGRRVYAGVAEVSIYIEREQRGRGVGKILLREMIRLSGENGFWTLQSGILQENTASIRLHLSCGFRMVGYRERIGRDRWGNWRNTVLMEKRSACNDSEAGARGTAGFRDRERSDKDMKKVAFICVHNSCRSQIAEALGKNLAADVFLSYSAGTAVKDRINPDAVRLMKQLYGIDMERDQRPKLLEEIPPVDVVITWAAMWSARICPRSAARTGAFPTRPAKATRFSSRSSGRSKKKSGRCGPTCCSGRMKTIERGSGNHAER